MFDTVFLNAYAFLLLRIIIAIVFFSSGWSHAQHPKERAKSIGMSPFTTFFLGISEIIGALSIALGIYIQLGALLLMVTMLGAIYKKIVVWKTGFYEENGYGWHYDVLLFSGCLVIFACHGGSLLIL